MLNPRKESKLHAKSDEHFATKGDLKDTEHHFDIAILNIKHEIKETELQLKHEIKETELRLTGEIKAFNRDKTIDRSILIGVFLMMIGYLIKTFIH